MYKLPNDYVTALLHIAVIYTFVLDGLHFTGKKGRNITMDNVR